MKSVRRVAQQALRKRLMAAGLAMLFCLAVLPACGRLGLGGDVLVDEAVWARDGWIYFVQENYGVRELRRERPSGRSQKITMDVVAGCDKGIWGALFRLPDGRPGVSRVCSDGTTDLLAYSSDGDQFSLLSTLDMHLDSISVSSLPLMGYVGKVNYLCQDIFLLQGDKVLPLPGRIKIGGHSWRMSDSVGGSSCTARGLERSPEALDNGAVAFLATADTIGSPDKILPEAKNTGGSIADLRWWIFYWKPGSAIAKEVSGPFIGARDLAISEDGRKAVIALADASRPELKIVNLANGKTSVLESGEKGTSVSFSPDGSHILYIDSLHNIKVLKI